MVELKYASTIFGRKTGLELSIDAGRLLFIITVVTGWQLPTHEDAIKILKDQFAKKLSESYENLNIDEFEYALRNCPVKDWGKAINLNLIDEVIDQYLESRVQLSAVEENLNTPPIQKIYTDEEILNQRRAEIETAYQAMRGGHLPIIHKYFHEILLADGLLKKVESIDLEDIQRETETVGEFFVRKLNSQAENIYVKQ